MVKLTDWEQKLSNSYYSAIKKWGRVCYFIMGNGGSGTRLTQRIIGSAPQVHNDGIPGFVSRQNMGDWRHMTAKKIVLKRDGGWQPQVNLNKVSADLRKAHWNIYWIFTLRRPARYEMIGKPQRLIEYMQAVLPQDLFVIWDNSLLFLDPGRFLKEMGILLNIDLSKFKEKIYNADDKWLAYHGINGGTE